MGRSSRVGAAATASALVVLALAAACLIGCSPSQGSGSVSRGERVDSLSSYGIDVYDVLLSGTAGDGGDVYDALRICPFVIYRLKFYPEDASGANEKCLESIDDLMAYYHENGRLPRDPDPQFGEYSTSMDAPLLAVAAELAFERTGDGRFAAYVDELIDLMCKGTDEGGFILKMDDGHWWPLEYAWRGVDEDSAEFVSNGSFFGMVCIEMLKNLTGDPRLEEVSEKALAAYEERAAEFYYPDDSWVYYSLNSPDGEKIIDTSEKLFIETRALKALWVLTGEDFYREELDHRMDVFSRNYPVCRVNTDTDNYLCLLRAGAPHPYITDIYPTLIKILDENGDEVGFATASTRFVKDAILYESINPTAVSYELYAVINSIEPTLVAKGDIRELSVGDVDVGPAAGTWSCDGDARESAGGAFVLDPTASEAGYGTVYYTFDEPRERGQETYWALLVESEGAEELTTRAYFYDDEGNGAWRSSYQCVPGKQLLVFSDKGFHDYEQAGGGIETVSVRFVTEGLSEPVEVRVSDIRWFQGAAQLAEYLRGFQFSDYWVIQE